MRKSSGSLRNSGTYTSPGTPEYEGGEMGGFQKGWSSERVPLPANGSRRHLNSPALMPFYSGRALPSKWEDAERWITSPVSAFGVYKSPVVQSRHIIKSKSGPLGTAGLMYLPNYSPPMLALEAGSARTFEGNSPFTTGVFMPNGIQLQYGADAASRSSRIMSDVLSESSIPSSQDGKNDGAEQTENMVSRVVSRRDMATQMSPDESSHSSPRRLSLGSMIPNSVSSTKDQHRDQQQNHSSKVDVRDVQVDKGTDVKMQLRKHRPRKTRRNTPDAQNSAPLWDVTQAGKDTSKLQREEAKIAAWENLQKAKAEAAVRKLEMQLEKRRSESVDKIENRLRVAELKAQEMRSSITESHATQGTTSKPRFGLKYTLIRRLTACFSCRAY